MNYRKIHDAIIERARNRSDNCIVESYYEKHHVIPKCLGGTDEANNLVRLTASEHFVVHQLLVKIYPEESKLAYAASMLTVSSPRHERVNNKYYSWLKKRFAEQLSNQRKGIPKSEDARRKMSVAKKGIVIGCKNNFYGKSHTQEFKDRLSEMKKLTHSGAGNPNAKIWNIRFPDGEVKQIKCLKDFCSELGVSVFRMRNNSVVGYEFIGEAS